MQISTDSVLSLTAFLQGIGASELLIILAIVLVIFGPKALPQLGRAVGGALREFKSASNKLSDEMQAPEEKLPPQAPAQREKAASTPPSAPQS